MAVLEKKRLSAAELESQTALELPDREMPLITVVLLNGNHIDVALGVAAQLCGVQAQVLAVLAAQFQDVECEQNGGNAGISHGAPKR